MSELLTLARFGGNSTVSVTLSWKTKAAITATASSSVHSCNTLSNTISDNNNASAVFNSHATLPFNLTTPDLSIYSYLFNIAQRVRYSILKAGSPEVKTLRARSYSIYINICKCV